MNKRKPTKTRKVKHPCEHCLMRKPSLAKVVFVGLTHDLWSVVKIVIMVLGYPVHVLSRLISREAKKHPKLKFLHSHAFVGVVMGSVLLAISFAVENYSHHPLYAATLETMRCAGVCPIWDTISGMTKITQELES